VLLTILGIVNDPTTEGIGDSDRALLYDEPYPRDRVM
jgi:phi LC3 family holin